MNYIDLILIIVALVSVFTCIQKGFIISTLELLSWLGSLVFAFLSNRVLSSGLENFFPALGNWASPLSFIISTLIFKLLLDQVANLIILDVPETVHRNIINRLLGSLPGIVNGLLWAGFLGVFLLLMPFNTRITQDAQDSKLADNLVSEVGWLGQKFSAVFSDALQETSTSLSMKVGSEESIKLPYTVKHPRSRPDLEAEMLVLVNRERQKKGLKLVLADTAMASVARQHAADMFGRGYFSHLTPEGASPFDRMATAKLNFLIAGENLALAQTLSIAHSGLMKSPGHRANILNPAFGRLGIGVLDGGIYGLMFTQNFRN
jgi:uncharacterized protein YkwD